MRSFDITEEETTTLQVTKPTVLIIFQRLIVRQLYFKKKRTKGIVTAILSTGIVSQR